MAVMIAGARCETLVLKRLGRQRSLGAQESYSRAPAFARIRRFQRRRCPAVARGGANKDQGRESIRPETKSDFTIFLQPSQDLVYAVSRAPHDSAGSSSLCSMSAIHFPSYARRALAHPMRENASWLAALNVKTIAPRSRICRCDDANAKCSALNRRRRPICSRDNAFSSFYD
jgi:hypothetical protein